MRVLYGYRLDAGRVVVDPLAAAVVSAVLAWEPRQRVGVSERAVRSLLPGLTREAAHKLVQRIRSHADAYCRGVAHVSLAPDTRLILSRAAQTPGQRKVHRPVDARKPRLGKDTPSPRLPDLGDVVRSRHR